MEQLCTLLVLCDSPRLYCSIWDCSRPTVYAR